MSDYLSTEEWIERAYITANELLNSEYINSVILLEYRQEYFYYILETEKDMDFLYPELVLTHSQELYNILFFFAYSAACKDKLTYVREHLLIEDANREKSEPDSAYKYLILDPPLEIAESLMKHERLVGNVSYQLDKRVLLIRLQDVKEEQRQ